MSDHSAVPQHIAIIMDGNRRWARQNGLEALKGHEYVSNKVIEPLVDRCLELKIPFLTLWAFSTENWRREPAEVQGLMQIFREGLQENGERLHKKGVRLENIGDISEFPADIQAGLQKWREVTAQNTNITVTFALNYGGRDEVVRAVKKIDKSEEGINEEGISASLDTAAVGLPDPDLIIRPGGEQRLSGFMPWQSIYTELYFTDVLMPDFDPQQLDIALEDYAQRSRRFGK